MTVKALRKPPMRKTKIVATLGPASSTAEVIRDMLENGMNVVRLNFSHGTHEEHARLLKIAREEAAKLGTPISVFQDLCGPKIRIGKVENDQIFIEEHQTIELRHTDGSIGNSQALYVEAFDPVEVLQPGEKIFLSDGQIELIVMRSEGRAVICRIVSGGALRSRSGISVPDSKLNLRCLTEKDMVDLAWGVEHELDYIAMSFVGTQGDVLDLRQKLSDLGSSIPIIAKIERGSALDNIAPIVEASDAVMVARGDLGLELPLERVPGAQKLIIEEANHRGVPVITATQMLQSMVKNTQPTRAEVSDVCTAVRDGTDAVMLSEETALGKHPALAVKVLAKILKEAECEFYYERSEPRLKGTDQVTVADAICYAACGAANKISASAILACTQSGYTARLVAKYRPHQTLFAPTSTRKALSRMALYWGVEPVYFALKDNCSMEDEITSAMTAVRDQYGLKPGARVVLTAGLKTKKTGATSVLEIREIPRTM